MLLRPRARSLASSGLSSSSGSPTGVSVVVGTSVVVVVVSVDEDVVVVDVDSGDVESAASGFVVLGVDVTSRLFRDSVNVSTEASVLE